MKSSKGRFVADWVCPDCGCRITKRRLNQLQAARAKLCDLPIHPERCHGKTFKGKHYHIPGVAGRFYSLSPKGKAVARVIEVLKKAKFDKEELAILHMITAPLSIELLKRTCE